MQSLLGEHSWKHWGVLSPASASLGTRGLSKLVSRHCLKIHKALTMSSHAPINYSYCSKRWVYMHPSNTHTVQRWVHMHPSTSHNVQWGNIHSCTLWVQSNSHSQRRYKHQMFLVQMHPWWQKLHKTFYFKFGVVPVLCLLVLCFFYTVIKALQSHIKIDTNNTYRERMDSHFYPWSTEWSNPLHFEGFQPEWYISTMIYYIVEIHHSGRKPPIYSSPSATTPTPPLVPLPKSLFFRLSPPSLSAFPLPLSLFSNNISLLLLSVSFYPFLYLTLLSKEQSKRVEHRTKGFKNGNTITCYYS